MDCLDGLRRLPHNSVALVFADPPYNIGVDYGNGDTSPRSLQWISGQNTPRVKSLGWTQQGIADDLGISQSFVVLAEEEIAQTMGISQQRVNQVLINLLVPSNFTSDKAKAREAIRLFLQGMSQRKIAGLFGVIYPTSSLTSALSIHPLSSHSCNACKRRPFKPSKSSGASFSLI